MNTFSKEGMSSPERAFSPGSGSRRERSRQARLSRIKEAAWALFVERGYAATTLRDIAARADVATGTIFLHVSDKADLLLMLFSEAIAAQSEDVFSPQRCSGPLGEVLPGLFTPFLKLYRPHPELAREFLREVLFHDGPWRDRELEQARAFTARLAALLGERQARGEVRADLDAGQFAVTLFSLYQVALLGWLSGMWSEEQARAQLQAQLELQAALVRVQPAASSQRSSE